MKSSAKSAEPPVDLEALARGVGADRAWIQALMLDFVRVTRAILAELERAAREGNDDGVQHLAHRLCGSARTVMARSLGEAAQLLEDAVLEGRTEAYAGLLDMLQREFRAVIEQVDGAAPRAG